MGMGSGQRHAGISAPAEAASRVNEFNRRRMEGDCSDNAIRIRRCDDIERDLRLAALSAERDVLFALARARSVSDRNCRKLVREIDLQEERLR